MAYIANWLNDHQQTEEATLMVEDTLSYLMQRSAVLDPFVPVKTYDDVDFLGYVIDKKRPIASVIAYGAEVPVTSVGDFSKFTGELFKSGLSYDYPEEKQRAMKKAMELATLKNITVQNMVMPDGTTVKGTNNTLAEYLFGTIADITRAHVDLLDVLTWKALQFGTVTHTDARTNATLSLNFIDGTASYSHFPSALSGGDLWTAYTTANGLQDLYNAIEVFIDTNGSKPKAVVMSRKLREHLMRQTSTRQALGSISTSLATVNAVGQVSTSSLAVVLEDREIPPIVTFDEQYNMEDTSKNVVKGRFLNTDRFVFLTEAMGERAMGPTLESDDQTGIFVKTREVTQFPPRDATQSVATMLPIFANPKLLYSQKVA
jgi:hypothetical protein